MSKQLVCGCFGTIYWAKILKDGLMSSSGRIDVTDDALNAVIQHLMSQPEWSRGFAGYEYNKKDGGKITLAIIDNDKWIVTRKNDDG